MEQQPRKLSVPDAEYEMFVIHGRRRPLRDFYFALLRLSWPATLGVIAGGFLLANSLFALGYRLTGGIAHAAPGAFADAFFFSVQTMGTIGYGAMYPESTAANLLVVFEAITSLILTALATGLVFAKFSRPTARVVFSEQVAIGPMNGVPTLALRVGNERGNYIVDARFRAMLSRTEKQSDGSVFYRSIDLALARDNAQAMSRAWNLLHPITESSPFFGQSPESIAAQELELHMMVVGLDDISMQMIHARKTYFARHITWGARPADMITERPDGAIVVDMRRFHELEATVASEAFPYPREPGTGSTRE